MTHLTALQLSMHADDGLSQEEAQQVSAHLASCVLCQQQLAEMRGEAQLLTAALTLEASADRHDQPIPKFARPASLREFALANIATVLVIWLAQFLWKTLFGELVVNAASWVTSVVAPDVYELSSATLLHFLQEGTAMLDAYLGFVVFGVVALTAAWLLLKYRQKHEAMSLCMVVLVGVSLAVPQPASALEFRKSESVITIAETETVDDTLIVAAETVLIKGDITGDLVAVGSRVEIDGDIAGNLVAFAETVVVRGDVGGLVLGAGEKFSLEGSAVGGDFWAAGESVSVDRGSQVAKNATVASEKAIVEGSIGKDLVSFAELIELNATVGEDLEAFGNRVRILDVAHIKGDARVRVSDKDQFERLDSAQIDGALEFIDLPQDFEKRSRYASGEFYLWQVARIVSAVLVGAVLLWLFPVFRSTSIGSGIAGLKTAGFGLLTLIGVPITALIIAITLVGLPFSFFAMLIWLAIVYLSKIVVGVYLGSMMLANTKYRDNTFLILLSGITTIIVLVNIPILGGFLNFVFLLVGMGLIVQRMIAAVNARGTSAATGTA